VRQVSQREDTATLAQDYCQIVIAKCIQIAYVVENFYSDWDKFYEKMSDFLPNAALA
jgi:hypothetical protein